MTTPNWCKRAAERIASYYFSNHHVLAQTKLFAKYIAEEAAKGDAEQQERFDAMAYEIHNIPACDSLESPFVEYRNGIPMYVRWLTEAARRHEERSKEQ